MPRKGIYKIGDEYYKLLYKEDGSYHEEDKGLWRAWKMEWSKGRFFPNDDDDYMIDDNLNIVARETGWCLEREKL